MLTTRTKRIARGRARRALAMGLIARASCRVCGSDVAEMHHPDYARPYEIVWLCRAHHASAHARPVDAGQLELWLGA